MNSSFAPSYLAEPDRGLVIAQATRGFLDIRFKVKNGIAIAGEAILGEFVKLREHEGPCLFFRTRQDAGVELFE